MNGQAALAVVLAALALAGCGGQQTQTTEGPPKSLTLDLGGGVTMQLALVPAGRFVMGAPPDLDMPDIDDETEHEVRLSRPFYMGVYEVTQGQYKAVMGANPSEHAYGDDYPVDSVLCPEMIEFCRKLSARSGRTVRRPTEAEWEYACRAGTTTAYPFGIDAGKLTEYAWCKTNCPDLKTRPVGGKKPNRWGLYDMLGNVCECCADGYAPYPPGPVTDPATPIDGRDPVVRGGHALAGPAEHYCRPTERSVWHESQNRDQMTGFRIVVEVP
jgi:formylglycine-generating enzyme required for sulfatase activity